MALIICKHCGKKVSDTVQNCIHCGETIYETTYETTSIKIEGLFETEEQLTPFERLTDKEQENLVTKFWKFDSKSHEYYKKRAILIAWSKLLTVVGTMFFIIELVLPIIKFVIDEFWYYALILGNSLFFAFLFIFDLFVIIKSRISRKRYLELIYEKKFQLWLEKEERIRYYPILMDKEEKITYEKINFEN